MAAKKSLKKVAAKLKAKASSAKAKVKAKAVTARASATRVAVKAKAQAKASSAKAKASAAKAKAAGASRLPYAPEGIRTITPNLVVADASAAIEFYKRAFGATEVMRMTGPDGKGIWHAQIRIGDSAIFINDAMDGKPTSRENPTPVTMMIYVKDCDAVYNRAVAAGATPTMPMADQFWGDRMGGLIDPFGNPWMVATQVKVLSEAEMRAATEAFARQMEQMSGGMPPPSSSGTPSSTGGAMA